MVARCSKTGKIVATRFGEVLTKEAIEPRPNIKFLGGDFSKQTIYLGKKREDNISIFFQEICPTGCRCPRNSENGVLSER